MKTLRLDVNAITLEVTEAGEGPLVLLVHGFPELAVSWTAQIKALSEAGYRVMAPDMRGYGGSDKPAEGAAYNIQHLVDDLAGLVERAGETEAVVIGHDWGASVAWQAALMRPDVFRAVVGLSVPFQPRRAKGPPTEVMAYMSHKAGLGDFYINRFQSPDAHLALDADVEASLRKLFWAFDGATAAEYRATGFMPHGCDLLETIADQARLPPWLSPEHFQTYVSAFERGGFKGPLDWYRNIDHNWATTEALQDQVIHQPGLFMVGALDPTRHYTGQQEAGLAQTVPELRGHVVMPGAGHWLQQERPDEVSQALIAFLDQL